MTDSDLTVRAVEALLTRQRDLQAENAELRVLVAARRRPWRFPLRSVLNVLGWLMLVGLLTLLLHGLLRVLIPARL